MSGPSRRGAIRTALGAGLAPLLPLSAREVARAGPPVAPKLQPRVHDEFSPLQVAIVHDAGNATDITRDQIRQKVRPDTLRDHPETGPVSRQRIIEQQSAFREYLSSEGVKLLEPVEIPGAGSQIFMRDPCFVVGNTLYIGAFRDDFRFAEIAGLGTIRNQVASIHDLVAEEVRIEGGDVIVLDGGNLTLVGTNRNTNQAGLRALQDHLEHTGTRVIEVPHRALHLDCALSPLPNGDALIVQRRLTPESITLIEPLFRRLHVVDPIEGLRYLAANLLWVNPECVVSSVTAPRTERLLRSLGFEVQTLLYSQIIAMWGSFRCAVCPIVRG